jgi:hypothetical protein
MKKDTCIHLVINKLCATYFMKDCKYKKLKKVMHEFKSKKLHSGSGSLVKKRKQAVAIALAEARKKCSCNKR